MIYGLIASHLVALVLGGYLHYRYGSAVAQDAKALEQKAERIRKAL